MLKNKKAQAIANEYVIYIILGIMVLVITAVLWGNYGRPVWNQLMSIKSPNMTAESQLGLTPFQIFVKEYKQCQMLPYDNCRCPFTQFTLPENGIINLVQSSSFADIKESDKNLLLMGYYKGQITESFWSGNTLKLDNLLSGCLIHPSSMPENKESVTVEKYCINNENSYANNINIYLSSISTSSKNNAPYIIKGNFDTSAYLKADSLFLSRNADRNVPFSIKVSYKPGASSAGISNLEKSYYLAGLYKTNQNSIYFVPTSVLSLSGEDQFRKETKECPIPNDFNKALNLFDRFTKSLSKCKETQPKIGAEILCEKFDFNNFPKDYTIKINPSTQPTIELSYKETKIKDLNFDNNIRINFNNQYSVFQSLIFNIDSLKEPNIISSEKENSKSIVITNPDYLELSKCANGDVCLATSQTAKSPTTSTLEVTRVIATAMASK